MPTDPSRRVTTPAHHPLRMVAHRVLAAANEGLPTVEYLRELLVSLTGLYAVRRASLWARDNSTVFRATLDRRRNRFEMTREAGGEIPSHRCEVPEGLRVSLTSDGSLLYGRGSADDDLHQTAVVPVRLETQLVGLLELEGLESGLFGPDDLVVLEEVAPTLALALASQRTQADLRERIKELSCLHGLARLSARVDLSLDQVLDEAVRLLPPAWQFPEIACALIETDGRTYRTPGYRTGPHRQESPIVIDGNERGLVAVTYTEEIPELANEPFLSWEDRLIRAVARQIALLIERKRAEEEKTRLRNQLRHADRLATIGQLAAGVAHELNEPLANVLGFAQLALKTEGLPSQTGEDLQNIETAALHAREVIRKLMFFGRQMPQRTERVDLNDVIEDGLYFLTSRCIKAGVTVDRDLHSELPSVSADPSQLNQVLVNLVVNAIQAMPKGGVLGLRTAREEEHVSLVVTDTGDGMSSEVREKAFLPFFTTKDVDQGTGLGLPVAHGIITSHGGTIEVESEPGQGTRFTVRLPVTEHGACSDD